MGRKWTDEEEKLLFSLYKEKSLDELSIIIGKSKDQIKSKGQRHHISFMNYWTENEDNYLKENFKTMTYEQIGAKIGRSKSAVQTRCRKLGLIKSKPSFKKKLNSNYFETIDTEEKAYWLGFICADGCVAFNKSSNAYVFKITLQERDQDHLRKFIMAINGEFDVNLKKAKLNFDGIYKEYNTCEVSFKDKKFTSDLLQYFSTNKTEYLRMPNQIPSALLRHFIRGFSDGDGCFYINYEKKKKSFEIVGKCYDMLDDIKHELGRNDISSNIYRKRQTNWKLGICSIKEINKLQSYLYDGATIFLERKFQKSQEILKLAS